MDDSSVCVDQQGSAIWFTLSVPVEVRQENHIFYMSCRALDVHGQGDTEDQAKASIVEALQLFVVSCYGRGVLDQVLKDCGFTPSHRPSVLGKNMSPCEQMIDVPLDLLFANHVQQTHAY